MIELPTDSEPARVVEGDCLEVLRALPPGCVDAVVTDPPYGLDFMGRGWDYGVPGVPYWSEVLRVVKPGGYLLAFGGTRTYHRLTCAIEDAGFEVRDCLMWLYGTGFPKGQGCLKPAWEPIVLVRKPGPKVLPLGIDACRVPTTESLHGSTVRDDIRGGRFGAGHRPNPGDIPDYEQNAAGRYPANVCHDGSDEVMEAFAAFGERSGPVIPARRSGVRSMSFGMGEGVRTGFPDSGTAARFFYCAKASRTERGAGNTHPTVKPLALMRWLVRLITPAGGRVLDPFCGSGTTLVAAVQEGMQALGIDSDAEPGSVDTARRRVREAMGTGLLAGVP